MYAFGGVKKRLESKMAKKRALCGVFCAAILGTWAVF